MTALAGSPSLLVIGALWRRSLNEVLLSLIHISEPTRPY